MHTEPLMTPELEHFLRASVRYALRSPSAASPSTSAPIAHEAPSQAHARRSLEEVVGDGFTWPELVALELIKREDQARRRRRSTGNAAHE